MELTTSSLEECDDHPDCPVSKTLKIIGGKWTMMILHQLFGGPRRFGELQKALSTISPKTLTVRLQELEHEGIIARRVYDQVPLKVEYSLTKKGKSLREIFDKISEWGDKFS